MLGSRDFELLCEAQTRAGHCHLASTKPAFFFRGWSLKEHLSEGGWQETRLREAAAGLGLLPGLSPLTFLPWLLCAWSSSAAWPGEMTFPGGERARKAASFWGKPLLCSSRFSGLGLGRSKWDPCPRRGSGGPGFSLADSAHSKDPFLFSEENSYAKHRTEQEADPSPTGVQRVCVFFL